MYGGLCDFRVTRVRSEHIHSVTLLSRREVRLSYGAPLL